MLIKSLRSKLDKFATIHNFNTWKMGLPLNEIVKTLQSFSPLTAAEEWDNVGLLVDPISDKNVENILLTNDLTESIVEEAVSTKSGLIVSYHPNIFKPLKTVGKAHWKERIVVHCIKNEIAVFSPHTSWDNKQGGVTDWLSSAFDCKSIELIQNSGRFLNLQQPLSVETIIQKVKTHIGTSHLQLALAKSKSLDSLVASVALCAGSGASILRGSPADLYLTGEMSHHDVLDAAQSGTHVILCNHSNTERGFLKVFQMELQNNLLGGKVNVIISREDKDPLITI